MLAVISVGSAESSDDHTIPEDYDAGYEAFENETKSRADAFTFSVEMPSYGFSRVFSETLTSLPSIAFFICSEPYFVSTRKYLKPPVSGDYEVYFIDDIKNKTNDGRPEWKPPDAFFLDENVTWSVRAPNASMFNCIFWR